MKNRALSLSQQALLLITLPISVMVVLIMALAVVEFQAEEETARTAKLLASANLSNHLIRQVYNMVMVTSGVSRNYKDLTESVKHAKHDIELLEADLTDDAEKVALRQAKQGLSEANALIDQYTDQMFSLTPDLEQKNKMVAAKTSIYTKLALVADVAQKKQAEQALVDPEIQNDFEHKLGLIILAGAVVSVLVATVAAVVLTMDVTRGLAVLSQNSIRLAVGAPFEASKNNNSDIAQLDNDFGRMANKIKNRKEKEADILNNASDVICSIDLEGRFTHVNPAAKEVFGKTPEQLLRTHFVDIIPVDDAVKTLEFMAQVAKGTATSCETRIRTDAGKIIDVAWSARFSESEQSVFCVIHDISERKQAERTKKDILAMVTHDLRTPLTNISHAIELFACGQFGELTKSGAKLLRAATRSVERMATLINDLLDMEKIQAGGFVLKIEPTAVADLFEQSLSALALMAAERQVSLVSSPTQLFAHVDRDRIEQVLINLLTNAIKFSDPGTTVRLEADCLSESLVNISVVDQGRGIPASMIGSIFERFKQVRSDDSGSGLGLGLAICREFVQMHGGEISVQSIEGKGSTFSFTVPLCGQGQADRV